MGKWFTRHWRMLFVLTAIALLAYAVSTPLWVPKVASNNVVFVGPDVIITLVSLLVAVLALLATAVGSFVMIQLKSEVQEQVRREFTKPMDVRHLMSSSHLFYVDYSRIWETSGFNRDMQGETRFLNMVRNAMVLARQAYEQAESLQDGPDSERYYEAVNALAYHLATRYLTFGHREQRRENPEDERRQALELAELLVPVSRQRPTYEETLAWIYLCCYPTGTAGYKEGEAKIREILGRSEIPFPWRELTTIKYKVLFGIEFH